MNPLNYVSRLIQRRDSRDLSVQEFEPTFIFLLTPPYSGSTAISRILQTDPAIGQLQERAEGQWLVKQMSGHDRWDPELCLDLQNLRNVWLKECLKQFKTHGRTLFIEKSPPNMMRIETLQNVFPRHILSASIRSPYAAISSMFHRTTDKVHQLDKIFRKRKLMSLAEIWCERSAKLRQNIEHHKIPFFSYEEFCADPEILSQKISETSLKDVIKIDSKAMIKVKDYETQGIVNYNAVQIGKLSDDDVLTISQTLRTRAENMRFFKYQIL